MDLSFFEILLLFIGFILLYLVGKMDSRITKMENQIKGFKYTLEQISKQVDVPENPVNKELRQLLKEDKEVQAVKKARETLGLSLLEAKQYIDALNVEK